MKTSFLSEPVNDRDVSPSETKGLQDAIASCYLAATATTPIPQVAAQISRRASSENAIAACVVLAENEAVIGLVRPSDVFCAAFGGNDTADLTLQDLITAEVPVVNLEADINPREILATLQQARLDYCPVVDDNQELLGILHWSDFLAIAPPAPLIQSHQALEDLTEDSLCAIQASLVIEEVLQTTANRLHEILGVSRCLIFQPNQEQQLTARYVSEATSQRESLVGVSCEFYRYYHDRLSQGQPVVLNRIDANCPTTIQTAAGECDIRAIAIIPLLYRGEYIGGISLHQCDRDRSWQATEITFLQKLANRCAIAIRHAQLYQEAQLELERRRQTEAELRASEERFSKSFHACHGSLALISLKDERLLDFNACFEQFLPGSRDGALGQSLPDLNLFPESDRALIQNAAQNPVCEVKTELPTADGNKAIVLLSVETFDLAGEPCALVTLNDITERERALAQLRVVIDTVPGFVSWFDRNGRYLGVNRHLAQTLNLSPEAFIGKELGFLKTSPTFVELMRRFLASEDTVISQVIDTKIGDTTHNYLIAAQKYDHEQAVISVGIDVTDRVRAQAALEDTNDKLEQKVIERTVALSEANYCLRAEVLERQRSEVSLHESEKRYRILADYATDMISRHSSEGIFLYVSPACSLLLGYAPEDLIGHSVYEFCHPNDCESLKATYHEITAAQSVTKISYRLRHRSGHYLWLESTGRALEPLSTDTSPEILVVSRDISDRKAIEKQLLDATTLQQAILNGTNYAIISTTPDGTIATFNTGAERLLGYSAEDIIGKVTPMLIHDPAEVRQRAYSLSEELNEPIQPGFEVFVAKAKRGISEEREWTYIHQDGQPIPVCLSVTTLRSESDEILGFLGIARDMTAQKQVQADLELRERAIVASNNGIVIVDANQADLPMIYVNPAFEKMTGYESGEVLGQNCRFLQGHETQQEGLNILRQALKKGEPCTVVLRNYRKDGSLFWNEVSISPIYDAQGKLTHYIGIQTDISDRIESEQNLEQAKGQLRAVIDAVPGMVSWIGSDCHYKGVNQHLAKAYNRQPEDFIGREVGFMENSPDFNESMRSFFDSPETSTTKELSAQVAGEVHNYLVVAQKYEEGQAAVSVGIDVTELKRAQEDLQATTSRMSSLIENLQAGVLVKNELGHVVLINQIFCDLFGFPEVPAAWIGADFSDFSTQVKHLFADPEDFVQKHQKICQNRQIVTNQEVKLVDGRTLEIDYIPIFVEGNYCGHLWMYRDISDRKKAEIELTEALAKEKELNDLKSRFITMTSHEFRTPLSSILSSAELLEHYRHRWTEEKQNTHFNRIRVSVQHMTQLLNDVLFIGKVEAGRLEFNPQTLNIIDFCQGLVEEFKIGVGAQHHLEYEVNLAEITAQGDEKLLRQILTNLLSNAVKYSSKDSTILLKVFLEGDRVIFQVKDNGIGIPPDEKSRLFESFHRATNVGNIQGTGLGLAIVKKCVELHQGKITVESEVDVGTTFTISIPS
ncbi:MAG: PAS domain S-box protein [Spirulinaceae cyanobacterium]